MAIPPEIEAELDDAYEMLRNMLSAVAHLGYDKRAVIGGLGRLYVELMKEELSDEERLFMLQALTAAMT